MDCPKPEEYDLENASDCSKDADGAEALAAKRAEATKSDPKINSAQTAGKTGQAGNGDAAIKLLQTMSLWLEGASCPSSDEALTGWSARYAAHFDQEDEQPNLDLAPILGLPQGTDREELFRVAEEQEEDLIKQLIS
jgi:hypothetical protein